MESNERLSLLNSNEGPATFGDRRLQLVADGSDVGTTTLAEEVEILGGSGGEPDARRAPPPARRKPSEAGNEKYSRAISIYLEVGEAAHDETSSINGCQALRRSRGITSSAHRSTSRAPSTKRSTSAGIPSRSTIS